MNVQEGFGNVLATSGSLTSDFWHLTSKQLEPETGLYYFYARWYDPQVGRFITWDPILRLLSVSKCEMDQALHLAPFFFSTQDVHPYTYPYNNPVNLVDADGKGWAWILPIGGKVVGGVVGGILLECAIGLGRGLIGGWQDCEVWIPCYEQGAIKTPPPTWCFYWGTLGCGPGPHPGHIAPQPCDKCERFKNRKNIQ